VTNEDFILDRHAFANERMAGDLTIAPDPGILLDLHEGSDLRVIANLTPVQVYEISQFHVPAQLHVRGH
jgi:hypothetical protein